MGEGGVFLLLPDVLTGGFELYLNGSALVDVDESVARGKRGIFAYPAGSCLSASNNVVGFELSSRNLRSGGSFLRGGACDHIHGDAFFNLMPQGCFNFSIAGSFCLSLLLFFVHQPRGNDLYALNRLVG